MTFFEQLEHRLKGKVLLVCCTEHYCQAYALDDGATVPQAEQTAFWEDAGSFYAMGGDVEAGPIWVRVENPDTPEARMIAGQFGKPVTLAFLRPSLVGLN